MKRKRLLSLIILVSALSFLLVPTQADKPSRHKQAHTLRWIEKLLANADKLPLRSARRSIEETGVKGYAFAQDVIGNYIHKYGASPRVLKYLAISHVGQGHFSSAIILYQKALRLSPKSSDLHRKLLAARNAQKLATQMSRQFTTPGPVLQINKLRRDGKDYYLVLRAQDFILFSAIPLKKLDVVPSSSMGYRPHLFIANVLGDKDPEIIFWNPEYDSGGRRTRISVMRLTQGKLKVIAEPEPLLDLWLEDLNGDGNFEVGGKKEIGRAMCHAEMPRWPQVFSWNKGNYRNADLQYPLEFCGKSRELQKTLAKYPLDIDLLIHKGWLHEINGQPKQALASYRRALKDYDDYEYAHTAKWIKSRIHYLRKTT